MPATCRLRYATPWPARHTLEIVERKASIDSAEFRAACGDIRPELNYIDGLIVMEGGWPIRAASSLISAVGVSGGDKELPEPLLR